MFYENGVQIFIKPHKTNLNLSPVQSNFNKIVFFNQYSICKNISH